jgi:hypothetical protein
MMKHTRRPKASLKNQIKSSTGSFQYNIIRLCRKEVERYLGFLKSPVRDTKIIRIGKILTTLFLKAIVCEIVWNIYLREKK